MPFSLKHLGVAFVLSAALASAGASTASAAEFHCSVEPCRVTLVSEGPTEVPAQIFYVTGPHLNVYLGCQNLTAEATLPTKTASALTFTNIVYSECGLGGQGVKMNGCDYLLTSAGEWSAKCPPGKKIELNVLGCTQTVSEGGPFSGLNIKNVVGDYLYFRVKSQTPVGEFAASTDSSPLYPYCTANYATDVYISNSASFAWAETDTAEPKFAKLWLE